MAGLCKGGNEPPGSFTAWAARKWRKWNEGMSCDVGEVTESLENQNELWRRWSDWKLGEWAHLRLSSFSNPLALPTSQLILQPFRCFTYSRAHSPNFPSLHLGHSSFSNPSLLYLHHSSFSNFSVASPTAELILHAFRHFTYVIAHSPTLPSLYLRYNSLSNPSVASLTADLILQTFRHFTYVIAHSSTLPSLYLRHSSFSNHSVVSPSSQLILQPFFRFSYVTGSSLTSPGEPPMFKYKVVWADILLFVKFPRDCLQALL